MANTLTPRDVYALVNKIVKEATGREDLEVIDTSSFVTVGETLMRTGTENVLNAISTVISRTLFDIRPYSQKLKLMHWNAERWGAYTREITSLYSETEQSTDYNTNVNVNQLADGNSVDMFKINTPKVMQLNYCGAEKLQKHITIFRDQLAQAFTSEREFASFYNMVMTNYANEIAIVNEAKSRGLLVNTIAAISSMGLTEVDLVKEFNDANGTSYTRTQILSAAHLSDFAKFVAATIKTYSDRITDPNTVYHASISGYAPLLRFTPKANQKMIMYGPLFTSIEANVYSEIFNPSYLNVGEMETVNYWQSMTTPEAINIKPNILDVATGQSKTAETAVELDYVVGILFDEKLMGVQEQYDYTSTTPFNSAGGYWNQYNHWRFNLCSNLTQQGIIFVLGEGGEDDSQQ